MNSATLSVNQHISKLLHSDIAIQKDLTRNLINMRALAKYVIKKYDVRASLDSVISAIRRFQSDELFEEEEKALLHIFKNALISTKNNMTVINTNLTEAEFHKRFCKNNGHHHSIKLVTGSDGIRIITEQKELDNYKNLFTKDELINIESDLSEISVMVNEQASHTKGVIARLTSELAMSNINLYELIVAMPEFLVYVKQKDLVKAHDSLLKLSKEA